MALVKRGSLFFKPGKSSCSSYAFQNQYSTFNKDFKSLSKMLTKFNKMKANIWADSVLLLKNTVLQIDMIAANRLKQANSLSGLYGQMYGSERLKSLLLALTKNLRNRSKHFLLGATISSLRLG